MYLMFVLRKFRVIYVVIEDDIIDEKIILLDLNSKLLFAPTLIDMGRMYK